MSEYEEWIKKNIEENRRVLKSLGLINSNLEPKSSDSNRPRKSIVKRRQKEDKKKEIQASYTPFRCTRRSSSLLKSAGFESLDEPVDKSYSEENTPPKKKAKIVRENVFGAIEGVEVGDWWTTRMECSAAGIHRPTVAGISAREGEGCYSIALSGGYEDDVDYGDFFTYTGCGGRDLKGTKANPKNLRTAPQSKDQVLDGPNAALASNIESKKPVRVIRGYKLQSPYAPDEGYRYDGLYSVEKCWIAKGLSGFKVYKFAFKRLSDQDPAPWKLYPFVSPEKPTENVCDSNKNVNNIMMENNFNEPQDTNILQSKALLINGDCNSTDIESNILTSPITKRRNRSSADRGSSTIVKSSVLSSPTNIPKDDNVNRSFEFTKRQQNNATSFAKIESVFSLNQCFDQSPDLFCSTRSKRANNFKTNCNEICTPKPNSLQTPSSSEKKIKFSTEEYYSNAEGIGFTERISHCSSVENICSGDLLENCNILKDTSTSESFIRNVPPESKKQKKILEYFEPIKNPIKPEPSKSIVVNPKSLRGNRFSSFSYVNPLTNSGISNESVSDSNSIKVLGENTYKASPQKKTYTPNTKNLGNSPIKKINRKRKAIDAEETSSNPTQLENTIEGNYELKVRKTRTPKKISNLAIYHQITPCSVVLTKLKFFRGWDTTGVHFNGFDQQEISISSKNLKSFEELLKTVNTETLDSSQYSFKGFSPIFHGWESKRHNLKNISLLDSVMKKSGK